MNPLKVKREGGEYSSKFRVQGPGARGRGPGFRVQGSGPEGVKFCDYSAC